MRFFQGGEEVRKRLHKVEINFYVTLKDLFDEGTDNSLVDILLSWFGAEHTVEVESLGQRRSSFFFDDNLSCPRGV